MHVHEARKVRSEQKPPFAMYGWASDNRDYWASKQTHNIRATNEIYAHALTTGVRKGLLGGKVVVADMHLTVAPTLAVAHYVETGETIIDGTPQPVFIRTTTTFRKEAGQWKVIGHHTDTLAYLEQ